MISARIDLERGWGDAMARRIEQEARAAIAPASEDGAKVAAEASRSRRRTGLMAEMDLLPTVTTPHGFSGGFRSRAWYAGLQSRGTKRGITPLRFLEKGRDAMRKSVVARLNRIG